MMGVLNFAHASFYMLGAYIAYSLARIIGFWPGQRKEHLPVGERCRLLELDVDGAHALQQRPLRQVVPQGFDIPLGGDAPRRVEHVGRDARAPSVQCRADRAPGHTDSVNDVDGA